MKKVADFINKIRSGDTIIPDAKRKELVAATQRSTQTLMDQLVSVYPELDAYFEKTQNSEGQEVRLPFHVPTVSPRFPITVDWASQGKVFSRSDSLAEEREKSSANFHDGNKYRLDYVNSDGQAQVGLGSYARMLDGSDYYRERIFANWSFWGEPELQVLYLKHSGLVKEWARHCREVMKGQYAGYHAAMAFSIAWLIDNGDAGSFLVATKGSDEKAVGARERHVCPAGMFEPSVGETTRSMIDMDDMRVYLAKEAIEEMHNNEGMEESRYSFSKLKEEVGKFHKKNTSHILDAIFDKLPCSLNYLGMVVDGFRLRPELVFLAKSTGDFHAEVNWEYDKEKTGPIPFASSDDFKKQVVDHHSQWVAPGMAAAYLASKVTHQNS